VVALIEQTENDMNQDETVANLLSARVFFRAQANKFLVVIFPLSREFQADYYPIIFCVGECSTPNYFRNMETIDEVKAMILRTHSYMHEADPINQQVLVWLLDFIER